MTDLSGKTAVITGSTSGIGLAMAEALAGAGANIVINGLGDANDNQDAIDAVKKVAAASGGDVSFNGANMMKPEEIEGLIADSQKQFGSIDILINNAGIQHVAPVEEFPAGKWDAIIAINLSSAFHTIRHAVPLMKEKGWGRIINTASAHSLVASPYKAAYVSAKHGIAGLTKTIALEVAEHGITVNAISPGYVWTPMVANQLEDTAKARNMTPEEVKTKVILENQPTKEFVTAEEIGATALFLCSDGAASITGANISVDGGWVAQ